MPMRAAVSHSAARNAVEQQVPSKCFFASPKHWQRLVHQSRVVVRSKQANDTEAAITLDGPLLGAVTIIGLSGTIAVSGASLCEIRLFNLFQWNQADIVFALNINSALLLLEALLFAPTYSIPPALAAAPSDGSSQSSNATQQQLVDIIAVRAASITSVDSWLLMLSLCRAMLRKPLTEKLPKQVRAYCQPKVIVHICWVAPCSCCDWRVRYACKWLADVAAVLWSCWHSPSTPSSLLLAVHSMWSSVQGLCCCCCCC